MLTCRWMQSTAEPADATRGSFVAAVRPAAPEGTFNPGPQASGN